MTTDWFIIDTANDTIIAAVSTTKTGPPDLVALWGEEKAQHYRATRTPTELQLEQYRFYRERP